MAYRDTEHRTWVSRIKSWYHHIPLVPPVVVDMAKARIEYSSLFIVSPPPRVLAAGCKGIECWQKIRNSGTAPGQFDLSCVITAPNGIVVKPTCRVGQENCGDVVKQIIKPGEFPMYYFNVTFEGLGLKPEDILSSIPGNIVYPIDLNELVRRERTWRYVFTLTPLGQKPIIRHTVHWVQ
jgi:hypothetical protein